jgi:hypothetical protein
MTKLSASQTQNGPRTKIRKKGVLNIEEVKMKHSWDELPFWELRVSKSFEFLGQNARGN